MQHHARQSSSTAGYDSRFLSAMALAASDSSTSFAELVEVLAIVSFRLGMVGRDGEAVRVTETVVLPASDEAKSSVKVTVAVAVLVDSSAIELLETLVSPPVSMLITTSAPSTSFCGDRPEEQSSLLLGGEGLCLYVRRLLYAVERRRGLLTRLGIFPVAELIVHVGREVTGEAVSICFREGSRL
ncbi:hypothetical protein KC325_g247 [Hortaea werneckii]|nr:hypothetical protein KC325_g247 [Hortaea werneckii]